MPTLSHHTAEIVAGISSKISVGGGAGVAAASATTMVTNAVTGGQSAINATESASLIASFGVYEWCLIAGAASAIIGLVVNFAMTWYFNSKRLMFEQMRVNAMDKANEMHYREDD